MRGNGFLVESAIKGIPLFASLPDRKIRELKQVLVEKHFKKNNIIFFEEDTQNYMYAIISGKVKVVHTNSSGKEHILAIHKSGDCFGEIAMLDGKTAQATVVAMEDTHILILSKRDFDEYLMKNDQTLKQIISVLCLRLREAWEMHRIMSMSRVEDRIRTVLKMMSRQYGVKDLRGTIIPIKLTHKDIADYASVSRETVTRFLRKMGRDGEIQVIDGKTLLLHHSFSEEKLS